MNMFAATIALGLALLVTGCEGKPDASKELLERSAKVRADVEKTIKEVNEKTKEAVDKFKTSMEATKADAAPTTKEVTEPTDSATRDAASGYLPDGLRATRKPK